jgi:AraC family transcriptional regulator
MSRAYAVDVRVLPLQRTAFLPGQGNHGDLSSVIGGLSGEVLAALQAARRTPTGPAYCRYIRMGAAGFDIEVGFPVGDYGAVPGVKSGLLGGGPALMTLHTGPYSRLQEAYDALESYMRRYHFEPEDALWDSYVTDPDSEPDPARWRTEIFWPVRDVDPSLD